MDDAGLYDGQTKITGDAFLRTFRLFDILILFVVLGSAIGIGVTSFRVATSPIFFVITLLFAPLFGLISFYFNFVFQSMVSPAVFNATLLFFPKTLIICTNLHWAMLLYMVIGSITLYAKREQGQFLG